MFGRSPTSAPAGFCRPCCLLNGLKIAPDVVKSGGSQRPTSLMWTACVPERTGGLGNRMVTSTSPRPWRNSALATTRPAASRTSATAPALWACAMAVVDVTATNAIADARENLSLRLLIEGPDMPRTALAAEFAAHQLCFVELDAQARGGRQVDVAVFDFEWRTSDL